MYEIVSGNLWYCIGSSAWCSVSDLERSEMKWQLRGPRGEGTWLVPFVVQWELTQHCKNNYAPIRRNPYTTAKTDKFYYIKLEKESRGKK